MNRLSQNQIDRIAAYIRIHGRPLEIAEWDALFHPENREPVLTQLLKYQNPDGGFGNGLEADIRMPGSSAIASAEAILIAYDHDLTLNTPWFQDLLGYFERTFKDSDGILSFWEKVPKEVEAFPHAPWWTYAKEARFSPNPCAIVASAFLKAGSPSQKALGIKITERCLSFLLSDDPCSDHDCYCLQTLIETLHDLKHPSLTPAVLKAMERRILECLCTDENRWMEYVAQPHHLVHSPQSLWIRLLEGHMEANLDYLVRTLKEEGYWEPNFAWGVDSELAHQVTREWRCHLAVKRVRILKAFNRIRS